MVNIKPVLPSGKRMNEGKVDPAMQQHIRALAQAVLQHLFYPVVLRYVGRRQRVILNDRAIQQWGWPAVQTSAENALMNASLLGMLLNGNGVGVGGGEWCSAGASTSGGGLVMPRRPSQSASSLYGGHPRSGSIPQRSVSPSGGGGALPTKVDPNFQLVLQMLLQDERRLHLQVVAGGETLMWSTEPAHSVLLVLSGSVIEYRPLMEAMMTAAAGAAAATEDGNQTAAAMLFAADGGGGATSFIDTPLQQQHQKKTRKRRTVLNDDGEPVEVEGTDVEEDELTPMPASRRHGVEVEEDDVVQQTTPLPSVGGGAPTAPAPAPQPRIISLPPPLGRAASGSPMASGGGQSSHHATRSAAGVPRFGEQQMTFTAPAVLGETACLGNFPYCATVRVESDVAVVATISRADYALLVASTGLLELQRTLLYEALREREVFMPFFAPLCRGRLRMCPLFSHVSDAVLDELREAAIPRVFPAGMLISEGENPKHVFFVRRGQVRREPDPKGYRDGTEVHCERLRNQALLVEGHTFGELPCAFRESTRDTYYAISNTDIYALPYATLELLMRSHPEVKLQLEAGAMALYESRGVAVPGLKFTPTLTDPRHYVDGVFPKDAMLLTLYKKAVLDQRLLAPGASGPSSRRVTIMDAGGVASLDGTLNGGVPTLHGGKVTPGMTEAIQLIPLLSLVTPPSFNQRCLALWKCTQYREGDVIVRRGEECNRVLFFYHGSSGVVMDERGYLVEGANRKTVVTIPKGQMVGYTCVRRHRWTRSIVCLQNLTEVWELKRSALVSLLQQFDCAEAVNTAVLQVLQPLCPILPEYSSTPGGRKSGGTTTVNNTMISSSGSGGGGGGASGGTAAAEELQRQQRESRRFLPLDSQPLLRPMLNSLWGSQPVPNLHPVSMNPTPLPLFPVWKPGDFPLSSSAADSSGGAAANRRSFSSRRMSYQVVQSLSQQNSLTNLNSNDLRSPSAQRQGNNTGEWVEVGEDRHRRSTGEGSELANTQRPAASKRNPDLRRGGERPHGANAHDDEVEAANAVLPPPVDRNVTVAPNGNLSILHEDGLQQFGGAVDNTSFSL